MELTSKQEEGLRTAVQRYRLGEKYTVISGYAGSGKTTLVRFIVQSLGVNPEEDVAYVAFTGKAAKVLQQKGCPNATTAHKLLYKARPKADGKYIFTPKDFIEYKIVVVDEISMLPRTMWELLCSHPIYIIACGDPGQLPPVSSDEDNHVLEHPHVFLDEIMRQAKESEIIRLSMHVRDGLPLSSFEPTGAQVQIINPSQVVTGMYEWADQILCATNRTRNNINQQLRALKGFGPEPQIGDKIISLRNHWDDLSTAHNALTNGTIGYLTEYVKQDLYVPRYIVSSGKIPVLLANFHTEDDDDFHNLYLDYNSLAIGEKLLDSRQEYQMRKSKTCPDAPYEFVYGYAITTHKAQGSEWDRVLVFEEKFPFDKEEHARWLYTACTRSASKLVLVR